MGATAAWLDHERGPCDVPLLVGRVLWDAVYGEHGDVFGPQHEHEAGRMGAKLLKELGL